MNYDSITYTLHIVFFVKLHKNIYILTCIEFNMSEKNLFNGYDNINIDVLDIDIVEW